MYPLKLKGISICFSMLKAALCGSYVNFGVFRWLTNESFRMDGDMYMLSNAASEDFFYFWLDSCFFKSIWVSEGLLKF